jgi:hypothetical protein
LRPRLPNDTRANGYAKYIGNHIDSVREINDAGGIRCSVENSIEHSRVVGRAIAFCAECFDVHDLFHWHILILWAASSEQVWLHFVEAGRDELLCAIHGRDVVTVRESNLPSLVIDLPKTPAIDHLLVASFDEDLLAH